MISRKRWTVLLASLAIAIFIVVLALHRHPTGSPVSSEVPVRVQHRFSTLKNEAAEYRDAVKETFLRGWHFYREKAWKHDELTPVSGGYKDPFGGWGATLVDSLDTLFIMDLRDDFEEAVKAACNISFTLESSSIDTINMFVTTVRHLGGFLAAYDLSGDERLLEKAVEVGNMNYASYDTKTGMPITRFDVREHGQQPAENGIIAELASASLEFIRLSQVTGDERYYDIVSHITDVLVQNQNRTKMPGMFPVVIGTATQDFSHGNDFSFGAMAGSAFEYFGKTWQLLLGRDARYRQLYHALEIASDYLLYRPSLPDQADVLVSATYHTDWQHRDNQLQHLSCFTGGMYLLGGRLFNNESHIKIGKKLTDGCVWAYKHAPLGIMPEILEMAACPGWNPCPYDEAQESPFAQIGDARYILRPEAIESVFYAYRITGDSKYQDAACEMFQAINKSTTTEYGNAAIRNVMVGDVEHEDSAESFWFAETLKYFYLIFSELELLSLGEWVFNTEAHPFRLPKAQ